VASLRFDLGPASSTLFMNHLTISTLYQAYVFRGMMVNEFDGRTYRCAGNEVTGCSCAFESELSGQCKIDGKAVLQYCDYPTGQLGKTVGIMVGIIAVYRVLGFLALRFKM
jgi:hypothetical protein